MPETLDLDERLKNDAPLAKNAPGIWDSLDQARASLGDPLWARTSDAMTYTGV